MPSPLLHRFSPVLLAVALASLSLGAAHAAEDTSSIAFSDPSKPGTLKISLTNGDLRITGSDTTEVTVRSDLQPQEKGQRRDGLRVLTSSASYSLTEKENVVTLNSGSDRWHGGNADFVITVPRNTSVVISNAFGGDINIRDVSGDLEVKSLNGEVELDAVSGAALVETMNGEISVRVASVVEGKPLSFTSMNGEVQLQLPAATKANVRLRTHNGTILTDFDESQLITKTASLPQRDRHNGRGLIDSDDLRATVREAVRVGMDAAREATRAAHDAIREARREMSQNSDNGRNDHDDVAIENEDPNPFPVPMPPMPPLPPMTGGKIVTGTLNGGGPEIHITTMNGDVTLRKVE